MTATKETKNPRAMRLLINAWLVTHPIWRSVTSRLYGFPKGWKVDTADYIYVTEEEARAARAVAAAEYAARVLSEREGV